jgi:murein DD-endopeptidase MepM/ murein hydrolase activator NlpD
MSDDRQFADSMQAENGNNEIPETRPFTELAEVIDFVAPPLLMTWNEFNALPITSQWGVRDNITPRNHNGIDYGASIGTRVNAVGNGVVTIVADDPHGYGNYIIIRHPSRNHSLYAHLNTIYVTQGQNVVAGQHIADSGNTGNSK